MQWNEITTKNDLWKPESNNDELIGTVSQINKDGMFGEEYIISSPTQGELKLPHHTSLMRKLSENEVKVGTPVKIVYQGTNQNNKGQQYNIYRVFVGDKP